MRIGLLLAGCGYLDGAEVQESVCALISLTKLGMDVEAIAPDVRSYHTINHQTGEEVNEVRHVLVESARISRGNVTPAHQVDVDELDGLVLAGGFGAAKNWCTFAFQGPECEVDPSVEGLLRKVKAQDKPIGAICIAPALVAKLFGQECQPELTIGNDEGTAQALESLGAKHVVCAVNECHVDKSNKIVSTPAYMLASNASEAFAGIDALCNAVVALA